MTETVPSKGQRDRSPSYPAIPLGSAIDRLVAFEAHFKRSPARLDKAGQAWGINQAGDVLAALKSYGLIEYQGPTDNREVVISEEGRTYLRAQQDSIKREVLRRLALRPKFIATMWSEWGRDRPSDAACLDTLVFKHKFSERGAPIFLKVYDATIGYAGLSDSDKNAGFDPVESETGAPVVEPSQFSSSVASQHFPPPLVSTDLVVPSVENDIKIYLDGSRIRVSASVDSAGLNRLMKKLKLAALMIDDVDGPNDIGNEDAEPL